MSARLTEAERAGLAELALLYGTFMLGRWAEVMASDDEPADDWQETAAAEAVDLFAPGAAEFLAARAAAGDDALRAAVEMEPAEAIALTVAWHQVERGEAPSPNVAAVCVMVLERIRRAALAAGGDQ